MSSFFDLKALTLVTSGLSDSTVLFGAASGQPETHPDPITAPALVSYLATKTSTFLDALGTPTQGQVPLRGTSSWGFSPWLLSGVAGNLQLGLADAAAPVAQILSVQSANTLNNSGVNWTLIGSLSAGSGTSGDIIFQTGVQSGVSGTKATPTAALTIKGETQQLNVATNVRVASVGSFVVTQQSQGITGNRSAVLIDTGGGGTLYLTGALQFTPFGIDAGSSDTILRRAASANFQFGAADAAAPIAQVLSVQNVVAGTSNTAGVDWTFNASRGTGTGAGGRFVFQTAAAGSSGTTQNALAQALVIAYPANGILMSSVSGISAISDVTHADAGYVKLVNSVIIGRLTGRDALQVDGNAAFGVVILNCGATGTTNALGFGNTNAADTVITRPAAAQIQLGATDAAAAVAQTLSVQSVIAGTSNTAGQDWTLNASRGTGTGAGGRFIFQNAPAGSTGTAQNSFTTGLIIGLGVLTLGLADAAAPVAQTLSVQSVVAGTSNTAGVNWTLRGSAGTGTGAGGSIILQTAAAGSSGTAQNAFSTVLTLASTLLATFGGNIQVLNNAAIGTSGGNLFVLGSGFNAVAINQGAGAVVALPSGAPLGWGSSANPLTLSTDLFLVRAGPAALQLGTFDAAAPVAQTLGVQNVVAGTSNTAGVNWTFKASAGTGTGASGSIIFQVAPSGASGTAQNAFQTTLTMRTSGVIDFNGAGASLSALGLAGNVLYLIASGTNTSGGSNYIKSSDGNPLVFGTSNTDRVSIASGGGLVTFISSAIATSAPNTQSGTTYTMVSTDGSLIFSNAATVTVTLLAASANTGRWLYVKNLGAGTLVSASSNVAPIGSATAGTAILAAGPGKWAALQSDGTNWIIMAAN